MFPSLSLLLPVRNAQAVLTGLVNQWTELLADLSPRWELRIIDLESVDDTAEVLHELALDYPQIQTWRAARHAGAGDLFRTALSQTRGELLALGLPGERREPQDLLRLVRALEKNDAVVMASHRPAGAAPLVRSAPGPLAWQGTEPTWQLIRRRVLEAWRLAQSGETPLEYLAARGFRWAEVAPPSSVPPPAGLRKLLPQKADKPSQSARPAGPNYLQKLKNFAWGE